MSEPSQVESRGGRVRVAHLVPTLNIGGVETAIVRSLAEMQARFDYRVFTVRGRGILDGQQRGISTLLWNVLSGSWRPDVVITSLWWAHPLGGICRAFGMPWLAFFHSGNFAHGIDRAILRWAWRKADRRLVDSQATADFMGGSKPSSYEVVPCVFDAVQPVAGEVERDIDLIWVGRNAKEKRLDLVREFVQRLALRVPQGRLALVVAGSAPEFVARMSEATGWQVDVFVSLSRKRVSALLQRARFYLLLSDYEGMSMSTIEAVQSGCVPIVRPVGEIPRYLDSASAIVVDDVSAESLDRIVQRVASVWRDERSQASLREQAQRNLRQFAHYVDELAASISRAAAKE